MRTTKELLEVMLENIDLLESGLCYYAAALARNDKKFHILNITI